MQAQDAIQQAIGAIKGMTQGQRNTLVTVVMAIVTNSRSVVETLHQNAPNDIAGALSMALNSMNPPKSSTVDCSQTMIEPSLPDAEAIADLMANCETSTLTNPQSLQIASALVCEIIHKAGGK